MLRLFLILSIALCASRADAQVLISILLGDKLNSDKLEFGLDGGLSSSYLQNLDPSKNKNSLNLGFYFDFKLKNPAWAVHTGVMVKSTMGARDVAVYSLNDVDLDQSFAEGKVKRSLGYFNVPVMMKYKFKNNFFFEGGLLFGLMNKSTDEFLASVQKKEDLSYKLNIRDRYHPLDAGAIGGIGYRLMGGNGMNIGVRYYYGFVDITIDDSTEDQFNRALYLVVGIPIGAVKKNPEGK